VAHSGSASTKTCESRPVVQPRDVHHALPDWLLLGEEALHHLLIGVHSGHGVNLLFWK